MQGREGRKYDVLIVEDNRDDVVFIEEALSESGFDVSLNAVRDGDEAIGYLDMISSGERVLPDLVFLDLNLPRRWGSSSSAT